MSITVFPFLILGFVLLMAGVFGRRGCREQAVRRSAAPVALALASLLMLMVGGLLLAGGLLVARRPPVAIWQSLSPLLPPPPVEQPWPIPVISPATYAASGVTQEVEAVPEAPAGRIRPAWMDAETGRIDGVYRTRVKVGPWLTRTECERQLPEALNEAVRAYADRLLGEGKGQYVNLPMSYIHEHIVRGEWEERRQQTIETMIYLHELLEFDRDANEMIEANYKQSAVAERLGYTAAGGGMLLGLLTIVFGYLRFDTLTRGYYTGRLRLAAATAILGLAVIAGWLVM